MHKLMEYICDELEEIERKAEKEGKLSGTEIEYADKLLNMKKNLLKAEDLYEESDYSMAGGSYARNNPNRMGNRGGRSYARGGRGGRRGGANQYGSYAMEGDYSRATEDMVEDLRELMQDAPDEHIKQEFQRFIRKIEQA